ncbi:cytochrome b-c1 complex subunit 7-2 [Quercus suber]|uniref:Cytochrome b-c1 complex subunit 7-2 n=1 Tax=Quercus suber TaxID=58331 RepID=A0AAW0JKH3_QUESU
MASLMKAIVDPKKNWLAALHMKSVSNRLRKYGLRYDDLYDPYYDLDIKEALNRQYKHHSGATFKKCWPLFAISHSYLRKNEYEKINRDAQCPLRSTVTKTLET